MAPKKRPAAAPAAGAPVAKKPAGVKETKVKKDVFGPKLKEIASTIKLAEGYPKAVLEMLSANVSVLATAKEERHPYQDAVIAQLKEVLAAHQASVEQKIVEAEGKLSTADADKVSNEAAAEEAVKVAEAKAEATEAAKASLASATAALKAAKDEHQTAKEAQKAFEGEIGESKDKKELLEGLLADFLGPLKEGTLTEGAVKGPALSALEDAAKKFQLEAGMAKSLRAAFSKAPADRGVFDVLVVDQVSDAFNKHLVDATEKLASSETIKAERDAKVAETAAGVEAAAEAEKTAKAALNAFQAAQKEAEANKKATAKTVKDFGPTIKNVTNELQAFKDSLKDLLEGPLAAFKELEERSAETPAEEAPPADAPADEPMPEA